MANYPTTASGSSFAQLDGSIELIIDDRTVDRAVNGQVKVRAFFPYVLRQWSLVHRMTLADWQTLQTFYDTNRLLFFGFTFQGDSVFYTNCMFLEPPSGAFDGTLVNVNVEIVQQQ